MLKNEVHLCVSLCLQSHAEQIGGVARSAEGVPNHSGAGRTSLYALVLTAGRGTGQPLRVFDPPPLLTALRSVNRGGHFMAYVSM